MTTQHRRRIPLGDLSNLIRPRETTANKADDRQRMDKGKRKATEPQPTSSGLALEGPGGASQTDSESPREDLVPRRPSYARAPATPPRASPPYVTSRSPFFDGDDEPVPSTSSSTPPQLTRPAFVELVETCPTPPSAATTESSRYRRRPLLQANPSAFSLALVNERGDDDTTAAAAAETSPEERSLELPSAWQNDLLSRRRIRQSRHSSDSAGTAAAPLSDLATAELVASLLLQGPQVTAALAADSQQGQPRRPSLETRRSSRLSSGPQSTSRRGEAEQTSPSLESPYGLSSLSRSFRSSAIPFRPSSASAPLRNRPSTVTLVSWELSHLPAPDTPREKPFKLPLRSIFLPTNYLGGGKGTGLYGDPCGPIERKVKREHVKPSDTSGENVGLGERWRRWSGRRSTATADGSRTSWDDAPSIAPSTEEVGALDNGPERPPSRSSSLLRRFSRRSWLSPSTALSHKAEEAAGKPVSRRQSLASAIFGSRRQSKAASTACSEDLEAWVSVVVR